MPAKVVRYTRYVTIAWCLFFAAQLSCFGCIAAICAGSRLVRFRHSAKRAADRPHGPGGVRLFGGSSFSMSLIPACIDTLAAFAHAPRHTCQPTMISGASGLAFCARGSDVRRPTRRRGHHANSISVRDRRPCQLLPDSPYVINFCTDRYRFAVAWAAAMLRGQMTLLPSSRDAAAVAALLADYPALYVLADDETDDHPRFTLRPIPHCSINDGGGRVPAFPPDQIAAVLFTSGSTGRPNPKPSPLGTACCQQSRRRRRAWTSSNTAARPLSPLSHMGIVTDLNPRLCCRCSMGCLLTADRPFFPADVACSAGLPRQRQSARDFWSRRRCIFARWSGDAATGHPQSRLWSIPVQAGFVLSATAPLSTELAARAETTFNAPVFEIYGCSEAGQLATRRTITGPVWHCLKAIPPASGCGRHLGFGTA